MKYRTRIIEVEAVSWTGDNLGEVKDFIGAAARFYAARGQSELTELRINIRGHTHLIPYGAYLVKGEPGGLGVYSGPHFRRVYEEIKDAKNDG